MTVKIEIINPLQLIDWDELIQTQPDATFFHSSDWARVLCSTYGYRPLYFTVRDNGNLLAMIPVMEIDSFLTGKRGVSLPFTDSCQPVIGSNVKPGEIWAAVKEYGKKANWKYIETRGGEGLNQGIPPSSWRYEHSINLSQGTQHLHDNFRDSHKRNIRKALREGVRVTVSDSLESIKDFHQLNLITRKRHGLPPQPFAFFRNIHQFVIEKKHGILLLARYHGKAVAGAIYFHSSTKAILKYAASDKQYQHLRSNNLVVWKALEWYCRHGYKDFNFGRTDPDHEGLRRFKLGWGAKEKTVDYYRYFFQPKGFASNVVELKRWQTSLLKKTPIPILKIIGSTIYRHIG